MLVTVRLGGVLLVAAASLCHNWAVRAQDSTQVPRDSVSVPADSVPLSQERLQAFGEVTDAEWLAGPPPDYPEANAIVIFDRGTQVVDCDPTHTWPPLVTLVRHVRIKALNARGAEAIGEVRIEVGRAKLSKVEGHTITPDGQVYEVLPERIYVKEYGPFKEHTFAFEQVDSGCILEYIYTVDGIRQGQLDPGFIDPWYFHGDLYALESSYTLRIAQGYGFRSRTRNIEEEARMPTVCPPDSLGFREFRWTLRDLPPIGDEPYMTCVEDYRSSVQFRVNTMTGLINIHFSLHPWKVLAPYFEKVIEDLTDTPWNFKNTVVAITGRDKSPSPRARKLYAYLTANFATRQKGYSLTAHHDQFAEIWDDKYGTAFEKNLLLWQGLRAIDIEARPTLICTRDQARFDPQWPSLDQFNHLIVRAELEDGPVFLDASSPFTPFGQLPPTCRADSGLLLGDSAAVISVTTPVPNSCRIDLVRARFDELGRAACSTEVLFSGYLAAAYGAEESFSTADEFIRSVLGGTSSGYAPGAFHSELDSLNRLRVTADFTIDEGVRRMEGSLVMNAPCCMFRENPFHSPRRFFGIDFNFPFYYHNVARIETPPGTVPDSPPDTVFGYDGLIFERQCVDQGEAVQVQSIIRINRSFFEKDEYPQVREFFEQVSNAITPRISFIRKE